MKDKILKLRKQGLTYAKIAESLNCAKSLVCYYCGNNQKLKMKQRQTKRRQKSHPFEMKLYNFTASPTSNKKSTIRRSKRTNHPYYDKWYITMRKKTDITIQDLINKFGENPKCYLTGDDIDINDVKSYHFDHVIPKSRGGDNSLDNIQIATKIANLSKSGMTPDEFIFLCKKVLEHNGYTIQKSPVEETNPLPNHRT
jgi:5-methylcytosine-specific restriction endonuclease McrA